MNDGMKVRPDYFEHRKFLDYVNNHLVEVVGCRIDSLAYHDKMKKSLTNILKYMHTPTSLFVRSFSDQIAVHKRWDKSFLYEVKTHMNREFSDCLLELTQAVCHVIFAKFLKVRCLYIFKNPFIPFECGFWAHKFPKIQKALIPERWEEANEEYFTKIFEFVFPDVPITRCRNSKTGSNDPYLFIAEEDIQSCGDWKILIHNYLYGYDLKLK